MDDGEGDRDVPTVPMGTEVYQIEAVARRSLTLEPVPVEYSSTIVSNPSCIASSIAISDAKDTNIIDKGISRAQWSADGTCVLTSNTGGLSTFVLPPDLLESPSHITLSPYYTLPLSISTVTFTPYPFFNLSEPSNCLVLSSHSDLPIRLSNALYPAELTANYKIISPTTEQYLTPHSLAFSACGKYIISGCNSLLAVHDVSRSGSLPLETHRTAPGGRGNGGVGMKGIIATLAKSPTNDVLAAGTLINRIGLFASEGRGELITTFSLTSVTHTTKDDPVGSGISQVSWSPCGNYLVAACRQSDLALVYDLRKGQRLSWMSGRRAETTQKLGFDVVPVGQGWEVWGGGTDGCVRMWRDPHCVEGEVKPSGEWSVHDYAVTTTLVHRCGNVVATTAAPDYALLRGDDSSESESDEDQSSESEDGSDGEGEAVQRRERSETTHDSMLRIWAI